MQVLFLDTETTGLNFQTDQIIEIGGAIFELNDSFELTFLDSFQSTVALRQKLDDKITRLTGITTEELATAPSLFQAQELWLDWVEKYQIKAIIGHSIDFDITFTTREKWYLPTTNKIDTLDLSKILLPEVSAVNLEFLAKTFELEDKIPSEISQNLTHHRSLYDCLMCSSLFSILLNKLNLAFADQAFLDFIKTHFLPLEINFFGGIVRSNLAKKEGLDLLPAKIEQGKDLSITGQISDSQELVELNSKSDTKVLQVNGEHKTLGTTQRVQLLSPKTDWQSHLVQDWGYTGNLTLAQLFGVFTRHLGGSNFLKFHSRNNDALGYAWQKAFLNCLEEQGLDIEKDLSANNSSTKTQLPAPETWLEKLNQLADYQFDCNPLVNNLEILRTILDSGSGLTKQIQLFLSQYDFAVYHVTSLMAGSYEYQLELDNPPNAQYAIVDKLKAMNHSWLQILEVLKRDYGMIERKTLPKLQNVDAKANLIQNVAQSLIKFGSSNTFPTNTVTLTNRGFLAFTWENSSFDLINWWQNISQVDNPVIKTNLSELSLRNFFKVLNLTIPENTELTTSQIDIIPNIVRTGNLEEVVIEQMEWSKQNQKSVFFLCSLNSGINKMQKIIEKLGVQEQVLFLGETGSITKIRSKIERGFVGLIIIKTSQAEYILSLKDKVAGSSIYIVEKPFLRLHNYWKRLANNTSDPAEYLNLIKKFYLINKINSYHSKTGGEISLVIGV